MCGRYALFRWNRDFAALPGFPADQQAQWNISPNDSVLMLRAEADGQRTLARARWGLTPPWLTDLSKTPAHARAETVAEQPMFREALRQRRCLLPANGFYEWRGTQRKRPFWLTPGEGSSLFFAAIWEAYPVDELAKAQEEWQSRLDACPEEHRPYLVLQYATPVRNQYRVKAGLPL